MARSLPLAGVTTGLTGAGLASLACTLALMVCASRASWHWWRRRRTSDRPIVTVHQIQPGTDGGDDCLWQKSILMGEKCELPDFSGIIIYDSAGNLLAPGRPRLTPPPGMK